MKSDRKGTQLPGNDFLLDLSFVSCSCAKQPPAGLDKLDTKCFDYYSLLKATDDNNGVFGYDSPLIRDTDCKPFINLTKFSRCQADNYDKTLMEIAAHTEDLLADYKYGTLQYTMLANKILLYGEYARAVSEQRNWPKEQRNCECVLELIDSWFNVNDKVLMSNALESILKAKEVQADFAIKIGEFTKNLEIAEEKYYKDEIKGSFDQWLEEGWGGFEPPKKELPPKADGELNYGAELSVEYWEQLKKEKQMKQEELDKIRKPYDEWKAETAILSDLFASIYNCKGKIDTWVAASAPLSYKANEEASTDGIYIDDIDVILAEIRIIRREVDSLLSDIKKVEEIARKHKITGKLAVLNQKVKKVSENLIELEAKISKLKDDIYITKAVTEDSFLVCRCGGIIKVVQNGDWINISKDQLVPNICDLLLCAEQYIYKLQNGNLPRDTRFSIIKAFNIVHGALLCLSEGKLTGLDYIIDEECEKARKPAAHIEITVRPKSDMLKQAKQLDAFMNAMSLIPGWIGIGFTLVLSAAAIYESTEVITMENFNTGEALLNVYHRFIKSDYLGKEVVGEVLDKYSAAVTLTTIINDLAYKSYAAFIGEIKIAISTYCENYVVRGKYDIFGRKEAEYEIKRTPYQKSIFLITEPEDNRTNINYKIYEDGIFYQVEESQIMY